MRQKLLDLGFVNPIGNLWQKGLFKGTIDGDTFLLLSPSFSYPILGGSGKMTLYGAFSVCSGDLEAVLTKTTLNDQKNYNKCSTKM